MKLKNGKGKWKLTCWTCGEEGHRSNECGKKNWVSEVQVAGAEAVVAEVTIGGCWWDIGAVEKEEWEAGETVDGNLASAMEPDWNTAKFPGGDGNIGDRINTLKV